MKIEKRTLRSDQVNLVTYTGTSVKVNLPRDKFVRRIYLKQHGDLDIDTLGTPVPSIAPSLISKFRLIRDGSTVIAEGDPSYFMMMDYVEHGGQPNNAVPHKATGDNQYWHSTLVLDFMINPMNEDEMFMLDSRGNIFTVMLPTADYSSFVLEVDIDASLSTSAMAGLYDTAPTTISDATALLDITLEEVFLEKGDPIVTRNNIYELRTIQTQKQLAASTTDLPYELTTGVLMRRIALFQYDAAGGTGNPARPAMGAPLIDRFKLMQSSPISWTIFDLDFDAMQAEDIREYNCTTMEMRSIAAGNVVKEDRDVGIALGFTVADFDNGRNLLGALDLTGMKSGDIKMLMRTTSTAGTSDYLYVVEQYIV